MSNDRIQHIDVWRFIAIAFVIISHLVAFSHPWYKNTLPDFISTAKNSGLIGVQIFFCISGFVICRGIMKEFQNSGTVSMRAFYIKRAYRIFPALAVYLLFVALLTVFGVFDLSVSQFLKAAAFLCNMRTVGPTCDWVIGHTWSLAYEEQFYLVFPLLFLFSQLVLNGNWILKGVSLLIVLVALALISKNSAMTTYFGNLLFIVTGCLSAFYWKKFDSILKKIPITAWFAIVLMVLVIGLLPQPLLLKRAYAFLLPLLICIMVFGTPVHHPFVQKIFGNSILSHFGRISFSVYLWQQLATANYGFTSPLIAIVLVGFTFVFAHYSYHLFELPLVREGNRLAAEHSASVKSSENIPLNNAL